MTGQNIYDAFMLAASLSGLCIVLTISLLIAQVIGRIKELMGIRNKHYLGKINRRKYDKI